MGNVHQLQLILQFCVSKHQPLISALKKFIAGLYAKPWFRYPYLAVLYGFAAYGFILVVVYFAVKFKWTNEGGGIDENNRQFQEMSDKYNQSFKVDSVSMAQHRYEALQRIVLLNDYYPKNAEYILTAYKESHNEELALRMLDAVDMRMKSNKKYMKAVKELKRKARNRKKTTGLSVFEWMNIMEWQDFKIAVAKDKYWIDSAAKMSGVEPRLIVACLAGEQIRLFNSSRESYKRYIGPMKVLVLENHLSYGVTGIKESTAAKIERYLKDKNSEFYLGEDHEHLLDYDSTNSYINNINDTMSLRVRRLVQFKNHYYSYLYAALFVKQINAQWTRAGYPLDKRPEILASLFNLGYQKSVPKKNPDVGGSVYTVGNTKYTFGSIAFEFYYSGELQDVFPYKKRSFDWQELED